MSLADTPARVRAAIRAGRRLMLAAAAGGGLLLLSPAAAGAAPTCLNAAGETVRCEAPNALPVGVSPPVEASDAREAEIPLPSPETLFGLVCVLGGLFALIGLMPDFDGWEHEGRGKRD